MEEKQEENTVRTILKSEITWLIFLIAGVMGFVSTVVLPIQRLQMDVAQIRIDLSSMDSVKERLTAVERELIKLQR